MKEEKKSVKNSGADSFLFSIFQRLIRPKETGQEETPESILDIKGSADVPGGGQMADSDAVYDIPAILAPPPASPPFSFRRNWRVSDRRAGVPGFAASFTVNPATSCPIPRK